MLLSHLRRDAGEAVKMCLDDGDSKDEIVNLCTNIMVHLSLLNIMFIGALTYGMINAIMDGIWWFILTFAMGYPLAIIMAFLVLFAKFMLDYINSYREK